MPTDEANEDQVQAMAMPTPPEEEPGKSEQAGVDELRLLAQLMEQEQPLQSSPLAQGKLAKKGANVQATLAPLPDLHALTESRGG